MFHSSTREPLLWGSIKRLESWISNNGPEGYDPYDIRESAALRAIEKISIARRAAHALEMLSPVRFRKILRIEKKVNPKAMGLLADSYLNLHLITGDARYRTKAEEYIHWLNDNSLKGYSGKCWGYPFNWQSKMLIPKDTPSGVVTSIIGNAYWRFYKLTQNQEYLDACKDICLFLANDLNIDRIVHDTLCFSYTPIDNFHVNNANLFASEFLLRIGKEINKQAYIDQGLSGINYTLNEQNADGSIFYWGKNHNYARSIDHYHSGFEMRSLYSAWKLTGERRIRDALNRYYDFYLGHMFMEKRIPKNTPARLNPIDIHSCSEAILCNTILSKEFPKGMPFLENSMEWIINNMQEKDGTFIYRLFLLHGIKWKVVIPYIRWGQAWMLYALTLALLTYCRNDHAAEG